MENQRLRIVGMTAASSGHEEGAHDALDDDTDASAVDENTTTASRPSSSNGQLRVGKHVCPAEYANAFTPMEFEEVGGLGRLRGWSRKPKGFGKVARGVTIRVAS